MKKRYTIAVDFDGVLHRYDSPWVAEDVIPDPPVDGAIDWLNTIGRDFDIVIHTTRARTQAGVAAVLRWLTTHGQVGPVAVTSEKMPALVYIDDRAWRFTGTFPTAQEIHQARPWNK